MKRALTVFMMAVLSLAAACAPSVPTPTPTPEPTPTPIRVLATQLEHLEGIWQNNWNASRGVGGPRYFRFDTSQNIRLGDNGPRVGFIAVNTTVEWVKSDLPGPARFWFEDGVYYEEGPICSSIGSYRAYLDIEDGRAVRLRFEEIDDHEYWCWQRRFERRVTYIRVD